MISGSSEADGKPGSVVKDHLSRQLIAQLLQRLTRDIGRGNRIALCLALLRMGFASVLMVARQNGELLPHLFTFTRENRIFRFSAGSLFSVTLSLPAVLAGSSRWEPSFPVEPGLSSRTIIMGFIIMAPAIPCLLPNFPVSLYQVNQFFYRDYFWVIGFLWRFLPDYN